jgi:predicted RNase H-like nuclease
VTRPPADVAGLLEAAAGAAVVTGYDTAWADRQPGALASIVTGADGTAAFVAPALATFDEARALCAALADRARFSLVAIDQPTIVPNRRGMRPVERALAPVLARRGGAIQPAYRERELFADGAPIWRFLAALAHGQAPASTPGATDGSQVIEVYPALALLGLVPELEQRSRVAKYNPRLTSFSHYDWKLICAYLAAYGEAEQVAGLPEWTRVWSRRADEGRRPAKADQDRLDAVICAVVGHAWWRRGAAAGLVIGDVDHGYVVTLADGALRVTLERAAECAHLYRPRRGDAPRRTPDRQ